MANEKYFICYWIQRCLNTNISLIISCILSLYILYEYVRFKFKKRTIKFEEKNWPFVCVPLSRFWCLSASSNKMWIEYKWRGRKKHVYRFKCVWLNMSVSVYVCGIQLIRAVDNIHGLQACKSISFRSCGYALVPFTFFSSFLFSSNSKRANVFKSAHPSLLFLKYVVVFFGVVFLLSSRSLSRKRN